MERAADDYEARYMAGEGGVLYRDKVRAPWYMHALLGVCGLGGVVGAAAGGAPEVAAVAGLLTAGVWTNFVALRVTVSRKKLHVQYGLFGPEIPVENIEAVKAGKYNWLKYGGKGIRFGLDGSTAYNMLGDKGQGVEITYRTKRGRRKTILVSSTDPAGLAAAIDEARAGAGTVASASEDALAGARERQGLLEARAEEPVPEAEQAEEAEKTALLAAERDA